MQQAMFQPLPKALKYLVLTLVIIELAATASEMGLSPASDMRRDLIIYGGLWPQFFWGTWEPLFTGQPILMLITHAFVHSGLIHMAMNTVILLAIGKRLTMVIGSNWVLALFFISAIAGGLLYVLLNADGAPAVGASGAAFGFFGFLKYLEYRMLRRQGLPLTPIFQFIGAMVAMNVVMWWGFDGMLAWEAHLGGFIAGWLLGTIFIRSRGQSTGFQSKHRQN
ncbi:MAG: rhomboid family intramembrane serine protease [Rhodobacteraceae bacterium]|nr:rhomboid family intramembrane serine protease [Paracoccaceae bacterium]